MAGGLGRDDESVAWLLESPEPGVRYRTLTELLGLDGSFGRFGGGKWTGVTAVVRILADLRLPEDDDRVAPLLDPLRDLHLARAMTVPVVNGLPANMSGGYGSLLELWCRFGDVNDRRLERLVAAILSFQWPDGGWNCDQKSARSSSFYMTVLAAAGRTHPTPTTAPTRSARRLKQARLVRTGRATLEALLADAGVDARVVAVETLAAPGTDPNPTRDVERASSGLGGVSLLAQCASVRVETSRSTGPVSSDPYHHAWRRRPGSGIERTTFIG